jgi:hypothetical protein
MMDKVVTDLQAVFQNASFMSKKEKLTEDEGFD